MRNRLRSWLYLGVSVAVLLAGPVVGVVAESPAAASETLSTNVLIPSSGATLSGTAATLDASATDATSVEFWILGGSYGFTGKMIGTATLTLYGWVATWNTTTVPNGSYALLSEAFNPGASTSSVFSAPVSITVSNPLSTSVLVPANGATLSGTTTVDASASNASSVEFRLFGGIYGYSAPVLCTATLTYYGWLCSWDTTTVPSGSYVLVSEASNSAGSAFSSGVSIAVNNPPSLVDLTGSFSGTTSYSGATGGCSFEEQVFDATYRGSSAVGSVTLHLDGCVNGTLEQQNWTYTGTFAIATSVGTLAGSADGPLAIVSGTSDDFELTLSNLSGTGAFAGTTGTIDVSILWAPPFGPQVTGSVSVP